MFVGSMSECLLSKAKDCSFSIFTDSETNVRNVKLTHEYLACFDVLFLPITIDLRKTITERHKISSENIVELMQQKGPSELFS